MPKASAAAAPQWRNTLVFVIDLNLDFIFELLHLQDGSARNRFTAHRGGRRDSDLALAGAAELQLTRVSVVDSIRGDIEREAVAGKRFLALLNLQFHIRCSTGGGGGECPDHLAIEFRGDDLHGHRYDKAARRDAGTWGVASAAVAGPSGWRTVGGRIRTHD